MTANELVWIARGYNDILEESSVAMDHNKLRAGPAYERKGKRSQCERPAIRDTLDVRSLLIAYFPKWKEPKESEADRSRFGTAIIDVVAE